jgi:hypothetical protein
MPVVAATSTSPGVKDDDPLHALSPHERLDLSGDSLDVDFNESSDAELEAVRQKSGFPSISSMDLDAPSPVRDTGVGHAHGVLGKIRFEIDILGLSPLSFFF